MTVGFTLGNLHPAFYPQQKGYKTAKYEVRCAASYEVAIVIAGIHIYN